MTLCPFCDQDQETAAGCSTPIVALSDDKGRGRDYARCPHAGEARCESCHAEPGALHHPVAASDGAAGPCPAELCPVDKKLLASCGHLDPRAKKTARKVKPSPGPLPI